MRQSFRKDGFGCNFQYQCHKEGVTTAWFILTFFIATILFLGVKTDKIFEPNCEIAHKKIDAVGIINSRDSIQDQAGR